MRHFRNIALLLFSIFTFPALVFAQAPANFKEVIQIFVQLLRNVFAVFIALIALGVAYGIFMYFASADNERKRTEIKGYLLWAVIGLAVVVSLWGILALLSNTFGWGTPGIPLITPPK